MVLFRKSLLFTVFSLFFRKKQINRAMTEIKAFVYVRDRKSVGQKSLWIFASRSKPDKRRERTNPFLFLGVKHFCPDLVLSLLNQRNVV
ncbi:hypothetical protein HMPREF9499_00770 [Enterococcus faecalis TX0012]|nr:hypothetical protein HMPREF9499_00770 [Enterococcus faecalis TX0012]